MRALYLQCFLAFTIVQICRSSLLKQRNVYRNASRKSPFYSPTEGGTCISGIDCTDDKNDENRPWCRSEIGDGWKRIRDHTEIQISSVVSYHFRNHYQKLQLLLESNDINGPNKHCEDNTAFEFSELDENETPNYNYKTSALCLHNDQSEMCVNGIRLPENLGKLRYIKAVGLVAELLYFSPNFIHTAFPHLQALSIKENWVIGKVLHYPSLKATDLIDSENVPETNHRALSALQFFDLNEVEAIVFPRDASIVTKYFGYAEKEKTKKSKITLKAFLLNDNNLENMILNFSSYNIDVELPITNKEGIIENLHFTRLVEEAGSQSINFNYSSFKGKINTFTIHDKINSVTKIIGKIWPTVDIFSDPCYSARFRTTDEGQSKEWWLQELKDLMAIPNDKKLMFDASQLKKKIKTHLLHEKRFIVVDMSRIANDIKNSPNKNLRVTTYFLVINNCIIEEVFQNYKDLVVEYIYLVFPDHCKQIHGLGIPAIDYVLNDKFKHVSNLRTLWPDTEIAIFYKVIKIAIDSFKQDAVDATTQYTRYLHSLFLNDFADMIIIKDEMTFLEEKIFENMRRQLRISSTMIRRKVGKYQMLSRFSVDIFTQKTQVYNNIAEILLSIKQSHESTQTTSKGQTLMLDIFKTKSSTDLDIASESLANFHKKRSETYTTFESLKKIRENRTESVANETEKFERAVKRRQNEAYFQAGLGIFKAIVGIFTGGIDAVGEVLKLGIKIEKLVRTIKKIYKMVQRLKAVFETLGNLAGDIMASYNDINVAQEGFDPGNMKKIVSSINSIDEADLLEWNEAEKHVEGMMDASLSMEIPETLGYKTALLKMIEAGKAETEAWMRVVEIDGQIVLAKFKQDAYSAELKTVENKIEEFNAETHDSEQNINIPKELEMYKKDLNFEVFLHLLDYCSASFYNTLQPCQVFKKVDLDSSFVSLIFLINRLQLNTIENLNSLFPPPQSFFDETVKVERQVFCKDIVPAFDTAYQENCPSNLQKKSVALDPCQTEMQVVMENLIKEFILPTNQKKRTSHASGEVTQKDASNFMQYYDECSINNVLEMKTRKSTSITITLRNKEFERYDRVRIEEVKVNLVGVKTTSGIVEVVVENNGMMQDRLNQEEFLFSASDKWKRIIKYDSNEADESKRYKLRGDIHATFRNTFNAPTVFTTWMIRISESSNPGLDLSMLEAIELKFSGSLIPSELQGVAYEHNPQEIKDATMVTNGKSSKNRRRKKVRKANNKVVKKIRNKI